MNKVVFMGTPQFSVPILEGLIKSPDYEVVAVVTQPDRKVGRKKILTPTPVKVLALQYNLPVLQPEKISGSKEMEDIIALEPDFLITAAFGQFLPESLLNAARIYALNVHASLLPKYRGGAPIHYAVMNGDEKTGVTIMEMIKKMDAGGIFSTRELCILKEDTTGTLFEKLSFIGRDLLLETLPKILNGLTPTPQNENEVTFSKNITKEQEKIDFTKNAKEIQQLVKALYPTPIAYGLFEGEQRIKFLAVHVANEVSNANPGTILSTTNELLVACGQNTVLSIDKLKPAGKKEMTVHEFLNGSGKNLRVGMSFQ